MPQITCSQVWSIIARNNRLFIPDVIEHAILQCLSEDIQTIKQAGEELKEVFEPVDRAITIDYNRPEIVDAYSLYYLRRNTLIARIAIRDMTLNQSLQSFPEELRVLDLGSGTGAVTLGLLEMFLHPPFNTISIHVDALDGSTACLNRLEQHKEASGLSSFSVDTLTQDIRNVALLDTLLNGRGSYDLIFAANLFNELEHAESCEILRCLSKHLADNAVIVIANAQRDFIKELQPLLVTEAHSNGLSVYYPCPTYDTSAHVCWFWRNHDYDCNRLRRKSGQFILSSHRDQLVATWLILCNKQLTIFDDFKLRHPDLEWGVFRFMKGDDSRSSDCVVCTSQGRKQIGPQAESYKRGAIVGCSGDQFQVQQYIEL